MKRINYIVLAIIVAIASCTKTEKTRTSGIDTIDNIIHTSTSYFEYGFLFSQAKLISNLATPGPDITIIVVPDSLSARITLQTNNLKPSFYKVGDYADESTATAAFNNLKTVSVSVWTDVADPINPNQVWIYRSGSETYTKFRIVSTINELRQSVQYAEITFQWVYQPDGSLTFPGK